MTRNNRAGFTLIEMLVVIAIILTIMGFALPAITRAQTRAQLTATLSNARQIYLSTFAMSTDGTQTGDARYGWPGDLAVSTDPRVQITTVSQFVQRLVDNDYLKAGDLKVFSAAGITPWNGRYIAPTTADTPGTLQPPFDGNTHCAFKIYRVKESDASNVIFLATKNYTYTGNPQTAIAPTTSPFGDKGFVIFRKGGDGAIFNKQQATSKTLVGVMPGSSDSDMDEAPISILQQQ